MFSYRGETYPETPTCPISLKGKLPPTPCFIVFGVSVFSGDRVAPDPMLFSLFAENSPAQDELAPTSLDWLLPGGK